MLYLAIPAQNEVATIGVLLWRLRTVLAEFPREYEVVVYDDASTDETADVAQQYASAMPVTVIRGKAPIGYAGAVDALVRYVSAATRYPRRDALLLLQGDFTDPPGIVPEFARRFEGGADIVVGERTAVVDAPTPVRRLFSVAGWALRPFVRVDGVKDLTSSMRLVRVSVLRDLLRGDDGTVCEGDTWTANADLLLRLVPHARRIESVPMEPTYGVRMRDTRRATVRDALASLRWGWRARGRRVLPAATVDVGSDRSRDRIETGREPARDTSRESSRDRGRDDAREASLGPLDRGRGQNHDRSKDPRRGADKRGREGASAAVGPGEAVEPREAIGAEAGPAHGKRTPSAESLEAAAARAAEHETARAARRDAARDAGRGGNQDRVKESARGNKKRTPPAEAAGAVTGKRPPAATDDTLLHDPFAAPRRSEEDTALNAIRGRTTHVKSPN
ncbi:MAG: glycosyltransferase, partial [Gemmatimonas sp.]